MSITVCHWLSLRDRGNLRGVVSILGGQYGPRPLKVHHFITIVDPSRYTFGGNNREFEV